MKFDQQLMNLLLSTLILLMHVCSNPGSTAVRYTDFLQLKQLNSNFNSIHLSFFAFNQTFSLELVKNNLLVVADSTLKIHNSLTKKNTLQLINAHPYQGKSSYLDDGSWARILFHKDPNSEASSDISKFIFEGAFSTSDGMYHITSVESYRISRRPGLDVDLVSPFERDEKHRNARLIIYKDTNNIHAHIPESVVNPTALESLSGCGYQSTEANFEAILKHRGLTQLPRTFKRQVNGTSGCKQATKKVLPMGVATDCTYTTAFGGPEKALLRILNNWNLASQVYEAAFNIQLMVVEVKILQSCGDGEDGEKLEWNVPCSRNFTINNRLSAFSQWRGLKSNDTAGLWHLMTQCNSGPQVGVAWLSMLCAKNQLQSGNQFVSGTGVSSIVPLEWKVVAHEIGHNFGAIHDCMSETCPTSCDTSSFSVACECCACTGCDCDGNYIMHPTDNSKLSEFSPCSIKYMCSNLALAVHNECLVNPEELKTVTTGICGNGVVEGTEECDCGLSCASDNCCDGNTCKFINGAKCDQLNDECCTQCQIKPFGVVCRESADVCTYQQTCDGKSSACAPSIVVPDTTPCGNNTTGAACASGVCTSRQEIQIIEAKLIVVQGSLQTVSDCGEPNSCSLSCATNSGKCLKLNGNFIDGTPCLAGGLCKNGVCTGTPILLSLEYYFQTQPLLAWPIAAIVALLLLTFIYCFVSTVCCRKKKKGSRSGNQYPFNNKKQSLAIYHPNDELNKENETLVNKSEGFLRQHQKEKLKYNQDEYHFRNEEKLPLNSLHNTYELQETNLGGNNYGSNFPPNEAHSHLQEGAPYSVDERSQNRNYNDSRYNANQQQYNPELNYASPTANKNPKNGYY
ncbi:hypothetical protein HK099_007311 [Clydaea vesicula]|uniref:Disintegrin and metalloproteinase domain-containing protein B n=1 Tax=Clydaea vesicula TaxID=447962 RepID=A0AAD5UBD3_9FUNG|nr:hypothetical protein HK099_007311 [Clydaea vesicula]